MSTRWWEKIVVLLIGLLIGLIIGLGMECSASVHSLFSVR